MTLTGRQIRKARKLLRWSRIRFMKSTSFTHAFSTAIESSDGPAWLTDDQEAAIRRACEKAGVRFEVDAEGQPSAVLFKVEP